MQRQRARAFAWILALLPAEGRTQPAAVCLPEFETLRYDEDYSCLADPSARRGSIDAIKYIALPLGSDSYLSLGGEARLRYDYKHNPTWGQDPQDPWGTFLQRYQLHADVHLGQRFRVFAQLRSAFENGRTGEPSPVEEGELDVQQAFADLEFLDGATADLTLRLGRQEVRLGSERLVSTREGPNVRRRFDGARALVGLGTWDLSASGKLRDSRAGAGDAEAPTVTLLEQGLAIRELPAGDSEAHNASVFPCSTIQGNPPTANQPASPGFAGPERESAMNFPPFRGVWPRGPAASKRRRAAAWPRAGRGPDRLYGRFGRFGFARESAHSGPSPVAAAGTRSGARDHRSSSRRGTRRRPGAQADRLGADPLRAR